MRAVLEGVAFALRDCGDALAATGTGIDSLVAVGGGSRSEYWLSAIATALGQPIAIPEAGDFGGAFGAARLAIMADTGDTTIATPPKIVRTVDPDVALAPAFAEAAARYRAAAQHLLELS